MLLKILMWTEYMKCQVCTHNFDLLLRLPITLACAHTICKSCLSSINRKLCPFDQTDYSVSFNHLPPNYALLQLFTDISMINRELPSSVIEKFTSENLKLYELSMKRIEEIGMLASPTGHIIETLSRPVHRKIIGAIQCQLLENEGRARMIRNARSLADRIVVEFILLHQDHNQLSKNLFAAIRARGCQFLGPMPQEEILKLVILAFGNNTPLSRKALAVFIVPRLKNVYASASKTNIGHVIQLLYRAGCFEVQKCDNDSSLMTLKEDFRTYDTLRLEHDAQIVQIANEAGLRIGPDQWSTLLYGNQNRKSHMQSIMDRRKNAISFTQSIDDLMLTLQKTGDPFKLGKLRDKLDNLSNISPSFDLNANVSWKECSEAIADVHEIVFTFVNFVANGKNKTPKNFIQPCLKYKVSMCKQMQEHGRCNRGTRCQFAHSVDEMQRYRVKDRSVAKSAAGTSRQAQKPPKSGTNNNSNNNENRPPVNIPAQTYANYFPPPILPPLPDFNINPIVLDPWFNLNSSSTYNQSASTSSSGFNNNIVANIQPPPISPDSFRFVQSNLLAGAFDINMSMAGMYDAIGEVGNMANTINQRQVNQINGPQIFNNNFDEYQGNILYNDDQIESEMRGQYFSILNNSSVDINDSYSGNLVTPPIANELENLNNVLQFVFRHE